MNIGKSFSLFFYFYIFRKHFWEHLQFSFLLSYRDSLNIYFSHILWIFTCWIMDDEYWNLFSLFFYFYILRKHFLRTFVKSFSFILQALLNIYFSHILCMFDSIHIFLLDNGRWILESFFFVFSFSYFP